MEPKIITQSHALSSAGPWRTIILTGLLAGTLDAIAAIVVSQASPAAVFKFIASGAFGAGKAFSGGDIMIVWGVLFHYFHRAFLDRAFLFYVSGITLDQKK